MFSKRNKPETSDDSNQEETTDDFDFLRGFLGC